MKLRQLLSVAVLVGLSASAVRAIDPNDAAIARIESPREKTGDGPATKTIPELMEQTQLPGLSVAVFKDFKIIWTKSYGVADVESKKPVDPKTLFQAASISKPVAAMAALSAAQEGRFGLDVPINSLLKSWKLAENDLTRARPVTPRMLLSHTGGTTAHGFPGYHPDAPHPTIQQILSGVPPANTKLVEVDIPPFTKFRYSGGGTTIMQLALIETLGEPLPDILDRRVLEPLAMSDSAYDQPPRPEREGRAARAHDAQGKTRDARWHVYPELSAAGLWTTPTDLAKFAIEVQLSLKGKSNRVVNPEMARAMVTPVEVGQFGLGFETEDRGDTWYFGHSGGNWGFRCDLLAHRDDGYGAVLMTNSDGGNTVIYEMRKRIAKEYGWAGSFDVEPKNWPKEKSK